MRLVTIILLFFSYYYLFSQTEVEFYHGSLNNHQFSDYPIESKCELGGLSDTIIWNELNHLPNYLKSDLTKQFKNDSNHFLSCYRFIKWNCGNACQMFAILDYHSGEVIDVLNSSLGFAFKPNSRLIIINPPSQTKVGIIYRNTYGEPKAYEFKKGKFREIKNQLHSSKLLRP